jgi:hypothetical protein
MVKGNKFKLYNKFFFLKYFNKKLFNLKHEKWFELKNRLKWRIERVKKRKILKVDLKKNLFRLRKLKKKRKLQRLLKIARIYKMKLKKKVFYKKLKKRIFKRSGSNKFLIQAVYKKTRIKSSYKKTIKKRLKVKFLKFKIKKLIRKIKKIRVVKQFKDNLFLTLKVGRWEKIKLRYKKELQTKRLLYIFYDRAITLKFFRSKTRSSKTLFAKLASFLIEPLFRVDVLLWNLHLFVSTNHVHQSLHNGIIYLNKKKIKESTFLKEGDAIQIDSKKTVFFNKRKHEFSSSKGFFSLVEIDTYLKYIVILKNIKDLNNSDLTLLNAEKLDVRSTRNFY